MKKIIIDDFFDMNCYIVERGDSCFVVDPGGNTELLKKELTGYKVLFVLLTHGHFDHIDGLRIFDCPIYIHENDYEMLINPKKALYHMLGGLVPSYDYRKLNIIKIKDNDIIPFVDQEIRVIHTPGHSSGSVCYLYRDKLFSGDTLFKGSIGRTDFPDSSYEAMKKSLVKIIDNLDDNIKVYPGHDEITSIKDEKKNNQYYLLCKKNQM